MCDYSTTPKSIKVCKDSETDCIEPLDERLLINNHAANTAPVVLLLTFQIGTVRYLYYFYSLIFSPQHLMQDDNNNLGYRPGNPLKMDPMSDQLIVSGSFQALASELVTLLN